jgi:hypothetical protein
MYSANCLAVESVCMSPAILFLIHVQTHFKHMFCCNKLSRGGRSVKLNRVDLNDV